MGQSHDETVVVSASGRTGGGWDAVSWTPEEKRVLASYVAIEKDGETLREAESDPVKLLAILAKEASSPGRNAMFQAIVLSEYFTFSKPGFYRIRFVLPDPAGVSKSNVLTIQIPKRKD